MIEHDGLSYITEIVVAPRRDGLAHGRWVSNATIRLACARCDAASTIEIDKDELNRVDPYNNFCIATQPDSLLNMCKTAQDRLDIIVDHICVPKRLAGHHGKFDFGARSAEQFECLATIYGDLAKEAGI